MPTSFLPSSEDAHPKLQPDENLSPSNSFSSEAMPQNLPPETPLPLEALEGHPEQNEHFLEDSLEPTPTKPATRVPPKSHQNNLAPIPSARDPFIIQIEKIMEEDLGDVFIALTPVQKQQFKIKGEETAKKIQHILKTTKVNLGKIIKLIFEWLKILPGVNRFFLEQEAKIKAEKIITLSVHNKHTQ